MKSMKKYGKVYVSSNNLVHNGFATVYHLEVKMVTYTFQKLLHWKLGFPQVQFLLLFTFKSDTLALICPKSLSRGWSYTRYEINFMVTPKALCLLLGPNESIDTQCFDTGELCNPWRTLLLLLSVRQCCIISTFKSSIFSYLL